MQETTFDVLFTPMITLVVADTGGVLAVKKVETDWSDSFRNTWQNNEAGHNDVELVADGADPYDYDVSELACKLLDDAKSHESPEKAAALLRQLADLIDPPK